MSEQWPALQKFNELSDVNDSAFTSKGKGREEVDTAKLSNIGDGERRLFRFMQDLEGTYRKGRTEPKLELAQVMLEKNFSLGRLGERSPSDVSSLLLQSCGWTEAANWT
jgi:hypothetical protein